MTPGELGCQVADAILPHSLQGPTADNLPNLGLAMRSACSAVNSAFRTNKFRAWEPAMHAGGIRAACRGPPVEPRGRHRLAVSTAVEGVEAMPWVSKRSTMTVCWPAMHAAGTKAACRSPPMEPRGNISRTTLTADCPMGRGAWPRKTSKNPLALLSAEEEPPAELVAQADTMLQTPEDGKLSPTVRTTWMPEDRP